ncbi:MAG: cytochrome b/b6 domain-containing protein [Nitrospinae bacterium]|nr:cytochrome b/b6 domain-containing protein [Nitrospinota bacterium]
MPHSGLTCPIPKPSTSRFGGRTPRPTRAPSTWAPTTGCSSKALRKLSASLRWHFALMWPYTINGLVFLLLLLLTEEGRHYRIRKADFSGAREMLLHPIKTFHHPPGEGKFNPIQKLAYNVVILAGVLSILTGLAILKPVQLGWLTWLFGGYQPSRFLHFLVMLFLVVFMIGHFLMVISHGWRRGLAPMIVGIKAERDAFRARQRQFAKKLGRAAEEAAILVLVFWLGGLVADMMNAALGGEAHGLWRLGLMRGRRVGDFWRKTRAGS